MPLHTKKLNKLPSEISTEDLLKSINTAQDAQESIKEPHSDVTRFLTHYELQSGAYPVRQSVIYRLYRAWSKDPDERYAFGVEAAKYLFSRQIGPKYYYLINKDAFKLEDRSYQLLKNRDKRKSPAYQKHFQNFLNAHSIQKGKIYIPCYAIHNLYKQWAGKRPALSYGSLFQFLELHFKSKRVETSKARAFGLSDNIKDYISEEKIKELKEARKRKSKRKNKKSSPKTQS